MTRVTCLAAVLLGVFFMAPVSAAEPPDLFHVWTLDKGIWTLHTTDGQTPPLNEKGKALYEKRVAARAAGQPIDDGTLECLPHGYPRLLLSPYPFRIYQKPQFVAFVHELQHIHRIVYLENAPPDQALGPLYMGYPTARYDGDRLVVTSVGFNDETTLDRSGLPHGEQLTLTETYRLLDKKARRMEAVFTIDDPEYYTQPWSARVVFKRGNDRQQFREYVCTDSNPEVALK